MDERRLFLTAVDAMNCGDLPRLRDLTHPQFVFHPIRAAVTGDYLGHDGIEAFLLDNAETFEAFTVDYDELEELPDGRLFAAGKVRIRGRGSHVDTVVVTAGYATFRDGLLAGWHDFGDRETARAAVGLEP